MTFDLVVRNGTVIDGSGMPSWKADVGVVGSRIARIGRIRERAPRELDAEGLVVTPGFIDCHTHMDAQVSWDPFGTSSCWQGVTSVVMGNCGFTLAPAHHDKRHLVMRTLERAEDISAEAMTQGINWTWETYAQYLDAVEALPKGINYAGYVGHSALRTWAMGERAFEGEATAEDLAVMATELEAALSAGAIGFSTSRSPNHLTSDDRPVPSRMASIEEVAALVQIMADVGGGVFELANEDTGNLANQDETDDDSERAYYEGLSQLSIKTGVPITFSVVCGLTSQGEHRKKLDLLDATAARGGRMFGQAHSRELNLVLSFKTQLPFDVLPEWQEVRSWPEDQQLAAFRDPTHKQRLVNAANHGNWIRRRGPVARTPNYDWIRVMDKPMPPYKSVADLAAARGVDPVECMIDLAVETKLEQFFLQPVLNGDIDAVLEIMRHPRCIVTFSDSGAHVSQILDSSIPTHLLGYWVRQREAFELEQAVKMLTLVPSSTWGFHDRGLLREGMAADLCVFDPATIGPGMPHVQRDLPGGGPRLVQKATGIAATVVNGEILMRDGNPTGALPGRLLRAQRDPVA